MCITISASQDEKGGGPTAKQKGVKENKNRQTHNPPAAKKKLNFHFVLLLICKSLNMTSASPTMAKSMDELGTSNPTSKGTAPIQVPGVKTSQ